MEVDVVDEGVGGEERVTALGGAGGGPLDLTARAAVAAAASGDGVDPPSEDPGGAVSGTPWWGWGLQRGPQAADTGTSFYDTVVDPDVDNNAHASELAFVGWNKRVLEVGCAAGHVTKVLVERGCSVVGVEGDAEAAEHARRYAEQVLVADLDVDEDAEHQVWSKLEADRFDVLLFGDVLEHLRNPLGVLRRAAPLLADGGFVVVSVPNIAHGDVRLALLGGSFRYRPTGLLDATHLRFFTRESAGELLRQAGLQVVEAHRALTPLFATEIGVRRQDIPAEVVEMVLRDPDAEVYQYVLKAVRDDGDVAVRQALVRLEELQERERSADIRLAAARAEAAGEVESRLRSEIDALRSELERLRRTRTFRWTQPARRHYGTLRKIFAR